ncbi:fertility inhibition protein FinO [Escherichia coli]
MMSIAQVRSAGSAGNYYTDKDNYYVLGSMGERWAGRGAEQLGLQGSVDKDVFTRLLEGRLPDGADLSRMQDGSNRHRPGYDLTFSAPKSVSMMAMLGGDKRLIDAHNQAVDFAVRQVEALASTRVMTDGQSETVLTGKRKTEGETLVRSRKTIINVTTPPKWKVKKQKLAEKAAREAELAAKKAQARQALSIYLNLPTLDDAVNTLKPWWPGLFDGDTPRLLACGIRDVLLEDVAQRNIPLSHKKLRRALKAITRSESYLCAMKAGACRYDTEGYVTEHISQEEEAYAAERLDKIRRQNRIKAELQAVLDEK